MPTRQRTRAPPDLSLILGKRAGAPSQDGEVDVDQQPCIQLRWRVVVLRGPHHGGDTRHGVGRDAGGRQNGLRGGRCAPRCRSARIVDRVIGTTGRLRPRPREPPVRRRREAIQALGQVLQRGTCASAPVPGQQIVPRSRAAAAGARPTIGDPRTTQRGFRCGLPSWIGPGADSGVAAGKVELDAVAEGSTNTWTCGVPGTVSADTRCRAPAGASSRADAPEQVKAAWSSALLRAPGETWPSRPPRDATPPARRDTASGGETGRAGASPRSSHDVDIEVAQLLGHDCIGAQVGSD